MSAKRLSLCLCLTFLLTLSLPPDAALAVTLGGGTVSVPALAIRDRPRADAEILGTAPSGAVVVVTGQTEGWYAVRYRDLVGYMSAAHVVFSERLEGDFGYAAPIGSGIALRAEPDPGSEALTFLPYGSELRVTEICGSWLRVESDGLSGYIRSDYAELRYTLSGSVSENGYSASETAGIALSGDLPRDTESSSAQLQAGSYSEGADPGIRLAERSLLYLGAPYLWGGSTEEEGFDCSGFVYRVFRDCGHSAPRTTNALYVSGAAVEPDGLRPGDLVFFTVGSGDDIGHMGLYIGGGEFIHASPVAGGVTIGELSSAYCQNHYAGARRLV